VDVDFGIVGELIVVDDMIRILCREVSVLLCSYSKQRVGGIDKYSIGGEFSSFSFTVLDNVS